MDAMKQVLLQRMEQSCQAIRKEYASLQLSNREWQKLLEAHLDYALETYPDNGKILFETHFEKSFKKTVRIYQKQKEKQLKEDIVVASDSVCEEAKKEVSCTQEELAENYAKKSGDEFGKSLELLTFEEQLALGKRIQEDHDEEARIILIEKNIRLVQKIASKYSAFGYPIDDLIQEGCIGLMKAVDRYDYKKGFHFSTYASFWIEQAIKRSIDSQEHMIRVPIHVYEKVRKNQKSIKTLEQELGRELTGDEVEKYFSIPKQLWLDYLNANNLVSLYKPIGEEEDSCVLDMIEDKNSSIEDQYFDHEMIDNVRGFLQDCRQRGLITEREYMVLILRHGFNGGDCHTLEAIGNALGVSRERVRQIERFAMKKIRRSRLLDELVAYTDDPEMSKKKLREYRRKSY